MILLSPAKIQDFRPEPILAPSTRPDFLDEAAGLVAQVRSLSISELADLLQVNANLAALNAERFGRWQLPFTDENAKQAVLVFNGEVFHGLDVRSLPMKHRAKLQDELRIFSGLYGLLRPFDLIQPYRLDIGDAFRTVSGEDLYSFWRHRLTTALNDELARRGDDWVLNLASGEYIRGIDRKKVKARIIDVDFLQMEPRGFKTVVVYTKKARGMMTRFVVENDIDDVEYLKAFDSEGYCYERSLSKPDKMVFVR